MVQDSTTGSSYLHDWPQSWRSVPGHLRWIVVYIQSRKYSGKGIQRLSGFSASSHRWVLFGGMGDLEGQFEGHFVL